MQAWNVLHAARCKCRIQNIAKIYHLRTTLLGYIFAIKAHIDNRKKKLVKQQCLPHMSSQYGELRPTSSWDLLASLGHPSTFQRVSRLGSVTAEHCSSGRQPNFASLNRGRHLYSAGWPSRWALAHILVSVCIVSYKVHIFSNVIINLFSVCYTMTFTDEFTSTSMHLVSIFYMMLCFVGSLINTRDDDAALFTGGFYVYTMQTAESAIKRKLNGSSEVETKIRKLSVTPPVTNDVQPTRRSSRVKHSKNAVQKQFKVSSSTTLQELKMKVTVCSVWIYTDTFTVHLDS